MSSDTPEKFDSSVSSDNSHEKIAPQVTSSLRQHKKESRKKFGLVLVEAEKLQSERNLNYKDVVHSLDELKKFKEDRHIESELLITDDEI